MKTIIMAALAAFTLAAPALAHDVPNHTHQDAVQTPTVVVSCYRGPWEQIIWDHPQAPFTDSLVAIGYSFERANAIARPQRNDQRAQNYQT